MPCTRCGKRWSRHHLIDYCVCGECNECHDGYVSHDFKHWYTPQLLDTLKNPLPKHLQPSPKRVLLGQSHGGHSAIPEPRYSKKH